MVVCDNGEKSFLKLYRKGSPVELAGSEITGLSLVTGRFWDRLEISTLGDSFTLWGVWSWKSHKLKAAIRKVVGKDIQQQAKKLRTPLIEFRSHAQSRFREDRYIRVSDIERLKKDYKTQCSDTAFQLKNLIRHPLASYGLRVDEHEKLFRQLAEMTSPRSAEVKRRNQRFVESEIAKYGNLFDRVESNPLTAEQREACVVFEDRNLLVAAAGSGKTSTIVGKVGYAIAKGLYKPSEILVLAFNTKAAAELNARIGERLKDTLNGQVVKAHTFHAMGKWAMKKAGSKRTNVASPKKKYIRSRMNEALGECLKEVQFAKDWIEFQTLYREPSFEDNSFETWEEYLSHIKWQKGRKKKGLPASYWSLAGDVVKSAEELAIANWLYLHSVPFEYEQRFPHSPAHWGNGYKPDFYYPEIGVWHEHFALDAQGRAPKFFEQGYAEQAVEKRELLNGTVGKNWFETQSAQYRCGTLLDTLKNTLQEKGQQLIQRPQEEVLEQMKAIGIHKSLGLFERVFDLAKSNALGRKEVEYRLARLLDRTRARSFNKVFWPFFEKYNERLIRNNQIEFSDMLWGGVRAIDSAEVQTPFKLILVDEFQDTSPGRAQMVKALLKKHKDSVLFGVGDDWQSINGFAGSDLSYFLDFEEKFGPTYEGHLTQTFRSAQGIADVAKLFVEENQEGQKRKEVHCKLYDRVDGPVDLVGLGKQKSWLEAIEEQLSELSSKYLRLDQRASVYLLGRYRAKHLDKEEFSGANEDSWLPALQSKYAGTLEISYNTVHGSKGLEADYVFLLGLGGVTAYSFPSKFTDDPILSVFLAEEDAFPFAEERRLFYVALTRAKRKVFLFFKMEMPSPFVIELAHPKYSPRVTAEKGETPAVCSGCGRGFLVPRTRQDGGVFLGCSNFGRTKCRGPKKKRSRAPINGPRRRPRR